MIKSRKTDISALLEDPSSSYSTFTTCEASTSASWLIVEANAESLRTRAKPPAVSKKVKVRSVKKWTKYVCCVWYYNFTKSKLGKSVDWNCSIYRYDLYRTFTCTYLACMPVFVIYDLQLTAVFFYTGVQYVHVCTGYIRKTVTYTFLKLVAVCQQLSCSF